MIKSLNIFKLLKTPQEKSIRIVDKNEFKINMISLESMHSFDFIKTEDKNQPIKSYVKIVEDSIEKYKAKQNEVFEGYLYQDCVNQIANTLAPHFTVSKNIGISITTNKINFIPKNILETISLALSLGYIDLSYQDINKEKLIKIYEEIKDLPVEIYFYNYWDINEYNIFVNREDFELEYFDVKYRETKLENLWEDLYRLYTYFATAGTSHRKYNAVVFIESPITRRVKEIWQSFKENFKHNPIISDYLDVYVDIDFKSKNIAIRITDENIRKFFLHDVKERRVKDWEDIRFSFYKAQDFVFDYLINHPFNQRFKIVEKINQLISEKALFYKIESNELGMAFESPREDFKLIHSLKNIEFFDEMKIYQYGKLNLFFVMAISEKRGLNFGAFFIDLTEKDINAVKFLNEKYLYLINNITDINDNFLNYEINQMVPAIKPGRLALELIQKSSRVRKI